MFLQFKRGYIHNNPLHVFWLVPVNCSAYANPPPAGLSRSLTSPVVLICWVRLQAVKLPAQMVEDLDLQWQLKRSAPPIAWHLGPFWPQSLVSGKLIDDDHSNTQDKPAYMSPIRRATSLR